MVVSTLLLSTTASVGNVKITYWGGKGRDLEGGREDLNEREVKRIKVDNHTEMEAPTKAQVPSLLSQDSLEKGSGMGLQY